MTCCIAAGLVSCQKATLEEGRQRLSISVDVLQTKTVEGVCELKSALKAEDGSSDIFVEKVERSLDVMDQVETKGQISFRNNLVNDGFIIDGYFGSDMSSSDQGSADDKDKATSGSRFMSVHAKYNSGLGCWETEEMWRRGVQHYFWAYYPASAGITLAPVTKPVTASTAVKFDYTSKKTEDLLVSAEASKLYEEGGSDKVELVEFKHALAAIKFSVPDVTEGVEILGISISGVKMSGTCTVNGSNISWAASGDAEKLVFDGVSRHSLDAGDFTGNNAIFVIPQTVANVEVAVRFKHPDSALAITKKFTISSQTWEAGKYYEYKIHANIKGSYIEDIKPELKPDGQVVVENGILKFTGSGTQGGYASFPGFDFSEYNKVVVNFYLEVGQDNKGVIYLKLGGQDSMPGQTELMNMTEDDAISKGYLMVSIPTANKEPHLFPAEGGTAVHKPTDYTPDPSAHDYWKISVTVDFNKFQPYLTAQHLDKGDLTLSFGYNGGNKGNAHWWVSRLGASVPVTGE